MKFLQLLIFLPFIGYGQPIYIVSTNAATDDSYTNSLLPTGTNNGVTNMYVDVFASKSSAYLRRSYIKFNIAALNIPANAIISSARLVLIPNGTEGGSDNTFSIYSCNSGWFESTLTHNSNITNNPYTPIIGTSSSVNSNRVFEIKELIQPIVEGRVPNNGFCIKRTDEQALSSVATNYFTREATIIARRPTLIIEYYFPFSITNAIITHASEESSSDASIYPTIQGGSTTTPNYVWYNSVGTQIATTQNLTNVQSGWYGLKVSGTVTDDEKYQAFLIGVLCKETTVTFNPGPNYIDDSYTYNYITGSGTSIWDRSQLNVGTYTNELAEKGNPTSNLWYNAKTLVKFNLWIDPTLNITSANLSLSGNAHNPQQRPNDSEFQKVTSYWREMGVSYNTLPTTTATGKILIPGTAVGNTNLTTDIASFWNDWKTNNTQNYGMLFQLQSYNNQLTRMQYYSSDYSTSSLRPSIIFKVNLINTNCDFTSHTYFKKELDGGYCTTAKNKIKVKFYDDYDHAPLTYNTIKLYKISNNSLIAGVSSSGGIVQSGTPLLNAYLLNYDLNARTYDLSGLSLVTNQFYLLELTKETGEKYYIKFKYTN